MKPRFSLLGDWNCTWEISYNVPAEDFLQQKVGGSDFKLEIPVSHLLKNIPSDVYEVKVAVPEGASIQRFSTGTANPSKTGETLSYSYLDFIGRPTLIFTFHNYLPKADKTDPRLVIEYSLQGGLLIIEPLYLVIGLMFCFLFYIFFSKLDLSFGSQDLQERLQLEAKTTKPAKQVTEQATTKTVKKK